MFDKGKKNSFDILSKKAKIEKVSILKDFSKISDIVNTREAKVVSAKNKLLEIDDKMQDLEKQNELIAHFGGDGKALQKFLRDKKRLSKEKSKIEEKMTELESELRVAQAKFEEIKKIVVSFSTKNAIIEDKLENLKIEEIESRNYQEEISYQDGNVNVKNRNK